MAKVLTEGVKEDIKTEELLVKNGLVFTEEGFREVTIKINEGKIVSIVEDEAGPMIETTGIIDASGCLVVPGFIDAHVHFNDPGRTDWEGIETGSCAAAMGGTTTIFDMPLNCSPSIINLQNLLEKREYLTSLSYIDYALWGGMTGTNLNNSQELAQMSERVIGWKSFMSESGIDDFKYLSPNELKQAMQAAKEHDKILALHAEWENDIARLTAINKKHPSMNERSAFLASRPISAEEKAVCYALELAAKYGTAIHFVHISSPKVVGLIEQAKRSGVDVTVETCPHYLIFDEEDFLREGAILKCAPPLRPRVEVEGLWECLANGMIDTIGSDHSPCLYSMKSTESIWDAWGGIQGVQFTWLAMVDEALKRGVSLKQVFPLGTSNVADRFGLADRKGRISPGLDADLVFIRLDETTAAEQESFGFRNPFSPYEGRIFSTRIKKTMLRGRVIYDDEFGMANEKLGVCL
ncbi:allantoinase AllB [Neobacillus cucumis]|uniref:Allantoinase AllB n=1 Tax=Neobacillus cucumis TaxID=1740721 RepID=A0A2N5HCI1_9BACI|nr:allantoinase AllB [Neobacillus cucumis]PLS03231.1 allantoinase AllB [Neobacillus cucumis]